MNRAYVEVMDENTKIREMAALQARVAKMESSRRSLLDLNSSEDKLSLGGLAGACSSRAPWPWRAGAGAKEASASKA
jgi:hypothetical protein